MDLTNYLSPMFGNKGWYEVVKNTYNLKNPLEEKGLYGLQTPISKVYSLLPFSDWYYEVENSEELSILIKGLNKLLQGQKYEARVLVENEDNFPVSTYRMNRLDPSARLKSMSKTTRRYTRQALKNELVLELQDSSATDRFYRLHALTRRKLGLPVQPDYFFRNIISEFPSSQFAFCRTADGIDIAAFFLLIGENILYYKYGASDPRFLGERPNHFLFYHLHDIAEKLGLELIDLGRTDEPGLHQFKKSLGATPMAIKTVGTSGSLPPHEVGTSTLKLRAALSHLPVSFHILMGRLFYRYFA